MFRSSVTAQSHKVDGATNLDTQPSATSFLYSTFSIVTLNNGAWRQL